MKAPLAGGPPYVTLAASQDDPLGLAADATSIYWVDNGSGYVTKLAKP